MLNVLCKLETTALSVDASQRARTLRICGVETIESTVATVVRVSQDIDTPATRAVGNATMSIDTAVV